VTPLHLLVLAAPGARTSTWSTEEIVSAATGVTTGLAILFLVSRLARRMPWPRPFRLRFAAMHLVAALASVAAWVVTSSALVSLFLGGSFVARVGDRWDESLFIGSLAYAIVAGISHAVEASARAARAEAAAARTQLAALRSQLQPHFLFNALHTVVQLIPVEPQRAMEAAELVADLLRATLEAQRDEVTLGDEWDFVSRYLAVERIRFGDRLVVRADMAPSLLDECVPAFSLQTLVENAVRHGAAPRVAATEIVVTAARSAAELTLSVRNTGDGATVRTTAAGAGTGLARLRERLAVLHGSAARLACRPVDGGGFEAVLVVPLSRGRES
jgi:two-component system, LytTR family, sensor kinase